MVLRIGHAESEAGKADAGSGTQAGGMRGACRLHLAGFPEVVAEREVHIVGGQVIHSHDDVVQQDSSFGYVLSRAEIMLAAPTGQVDERGRYPERGMIESFGESHLQRIGQFLVRIPEGFDLSAQVAGRDGEGKVCLIVVVVESQVGGEGHGREMTVVRVDDFAGCAAGPPVAQVVGIHAAHGKVGGREAARHGVVGGSLVHASVVDELCRDAQGGTFAQNLDKRRASGMASLHVGHVVEAYRLVAHGGEKGRIGKDKRGVVFHQRYVASAQRRGMGRHRQFHEVEHGVALLCMDGGGRTYI